MLVIGNDDYLFFAYGWKYGNRLFNYKCDSDKLIVTYNIKENLRNYSYTVIEDSGVNRLICAITDHLELSEISQVIDNCTVDNTVNNAGMTTGKSRFDISPTQLSNKYPIVLIKRLENCDKAPFEVNTKDTFRIKDLYLKETQMKRGAVRAFNGYDTKGDISSYSIQREKELVDRKSVIIGMPKEKLSKAVPLEECDSNHFGRIKLSPNCNKYSTGAFYSKVSSSSPTISHNHKKAKIDKPKTNERGHIPLKTNSLKNSEATMELQFTNKPAEKKYTNDKRISNKTDIMLSNSKQLSYNQIFIAYNSCQSKPIAHVEPFYSKSNCSRDKASEKKVLANESKVNCSSLVAMNQEDCHKNKQGTNNVSTVSITKDNNGSYHIKKSRDKVTSNFSTNSNVSNKDTWEKSNLAGSSKISTSLEAIDLSLNTSNGNDKFSIDCPSKNKEVDTSNSNEVAILSKNGFDIVQMRRKLHMRNKQSWMAGKMGRSLSLGDLKQLNENICRMKKRNLSLPNLTSSKLIEPSIVGLREEIHSNFEDIISSGTSTADDIEESCTDDDENSLHVDVELKNVDTGATDLHMEELEPNDLYAENYSILYKKRNKRRGKEYKVKRHSHITNTTKSHEQKGIQKRRSEKKKEKSNGAIINEITLQQQVLNEQEKGKRLAQELPGFNWLEEKIRNTSDCTKAEDNNKTEKIVQDDKKPSPAVTKDQPSNDLKASNKFIPVLISHTGKAGLNTKESNHQPTATASNQTDLNVSGDSLSKMTLNTVTSSTPRHSPISDEETKQPDPPANESRHEMEKDRPSNPISYLKRHIQTAVPPLIRTYKVTPLPKQRKGSVDMKPPSNRTLDRQEHDSVQNDGTAPIHQLKTQQELDINYSMNNTEDVPSDSENVNIVSTKSRTSNNKLSILKEAFKSKLNGCSEMQSSEAQCNDDPTIRRQSVLEVNSKKNTVEESVTRNELTSEETRRNYQLTQISKASFQPESTIRSVADSLLCKILTQDNKTSMDSPIVISTLVDELLKTKREVEKLREVQEKMLKAGICYQSVREFEDEKNIKDKHPPTNSSSPGCHTQQRIAEIQENNSGVLQGVEAKNTRKRECSTEKNSANKKQKTSSQQTSEEPNTITIRYTLPQPPSEFHRETAESRDEAKLRNIFGIQNNDLDVVPVDKRSPFPRQDEKLPRKLAPHSTNVSLKYPQEMSIPNEEPYKNELLKLLDPSNSYQRSPLPELPNLIPSTNCSPLTFQKNLSFYGDKMPSNLVRYSYPHQSSGIHPKPAIIAMDHYGYHPSMSYENRNEGVLQMELQRPHTQKPSLVKHSDKLYNSVNNRISPAHREVITARNERYSNYSYPNHYNAKSSYETTKIAKPTIATSPQTFQPKILIPPESSNSHYKEWHAVHHSNPVGDAHSHRITAQAPIHVKSQPNPIVSSSYYKSGMDTKTTETYSSHKPYPSTVTQCDSTMKRREKSCSPEGVRVTNSGNSYISASEMAHSSANAYFASQMRTMQSNTPTRLNSSHSQYPQVLISNRNPVASKQVYYDQMPVIQAPAAQKLVTTYAHRTYSPPLQRRDDQQTQRYMLPRPQVYDNRPVPLDETNKQPPHQSNNLSPDISQPRIINHNQTKQLQEAVINCSPNASADTVTSKATSKNCLICGSLAQFLCSGCKLGWYCSKECQREHWNEHSPNCVMKR